MIRKGLRRSVAVTCAGLVALSTAYVPSVAHAAERAAPPATTNAAAWLIRDLEQGALSGPAPGPDWGLTIDALFGLYATGQGASSAGEMIKKIAANTGYFMGPDLYRDRDVRLGGQAAKLLTAAIVAGKDPTAFGHGTYARSKPYDLRAEVLSLLVPKGPQAGRLRDRGTQSDLTNVFGQSFAVIGLSRSGGGADSAADFLTTQQCAAGFFRVSFDDNRTCDAANGVADTDATAIALQALMVARDQGVSGLDAAIGRGIRWLVRSQHSDGSFVGGTTTDSPNANTTGLAAQTLKAAGQRAAYEKARGWVSTLVVTPAAARGTKLSAEVGAIAYDPSTLKRAEETGISEAARDTWRRTTSQAVFALAPASFTSLGSQTLRRDPTVPQVAGPEQDPPETDDPQSDGPENEPTDDAPEPDPDSTPEPEPQTEPEDTPSGRDTDKPAEDRASEGDASARLGRFLAGSLTDGDYVEVRKDGKTYVDYDLTADTALALRLLGEQDSAADAATTFLLEKAAVESYAHGAPYEESGAAYAEPLAKLTTLAQWLPAKSRAETVDALGGDLVALQGESGAFDDTGEYADKSQSTERQAWVVLALRTVGRDTEADAAVDALLDVQCADGGFAADLAQSGCAEGDLAATGMAVQAVNAVTPTTPEVSTSPASVRTGVASDPTGLSDDRVVSLAGAAEYLQRSSAPTGALAPASAGSGPDWPATAAVAAGRQAIGLDITNTTDLVSAQLHADGGIAVGGADAASDLATSVGVAPAVAGRSWLSAPGSALTSAALMPLDVPDEPAAAPAQVDSDDPVLPPWAIYTLASLLGAVLVLSIGLLLTRLNRSLPTRFESRRLRR